MAFKLTKDEKEQRDELVERLGDAAQELSAAVATFNAAMEDLKAPLEAALEKYNGVAEEAREFAQDIASQADADISDKSERWQESERGQAAEAFKSEWENLSLDDVEIELPEEVSFDDPDHSAALDGAPEQAE